MLLPKDPHGCPYLFLAPMEGVGDRCFRKAMATIGGFDEAICDFLRVPRNAHIKSLASDYQASELGEYPLAAQIMGSDPDLMAEMGLELERRGAKHLNINCGCPSNTVTGRGAGSSLLKEPNFLNQVARAVVKAVSIPVTIKMRSGYEDTSLFRENLFAAQESGIHYLIIHPRTKVDGYGPPARWDLIAEAKSILRIPVVGNGDIHNVEDAVRMLHATNCDALMVGRGSVANPFIFHEIKSYFSKQPYISTWGQIERYIETYQNEISAEMAEKSRINKFKQLFSFLFKKNEKLLAKRPLILTSAIKEPDIFRDFALSHLREGWI